MKYYNIKVNGKNYQVEVEEVAAAAQVATPAAVIPSPAAAQAPAVAAAPAAENTVETAAAPAGATPVRAPMPGTVLNVKVEVGQKLEANTVLCILEAMKMENEIIFPGTGTLVQVAVSNGKTVNAGDLLFSVQE